AQDGKVNRRGMPNLLQLAVFAREFADVIQFTRPPRLVQRLLFGLLSIPARLLGYRGSYPQYLARGPLETVPAESLDGAAALADWPPASSSNERPFLPPAHIRSGNAVRPPASCVEATAGACAETTRSPS